MTRAHQSFLTQGVSEKSFDYDVLEWIPKVDPNRKPRTRSELGYIVVREIASKKISGMLSRTRHGYFIVDIDARPHRVNGRKLRKIVMELECLDTQTR